MSNKILVFGIGSLVQSDDGFGVHIIKELLKEKESLPENVTLLDAGTSIVDQLRDLSDADQLICVDVADGGMPPGTIYRFEPGDIAYKKSRFHHAHKITIFDALEMVRAMEKKVPQTSIIAVQPEIIDWGMNLSPVIEAQVPKVIRLIRDEIQKINSLQVAE